MPPRPKRFASALVPVVLAQVRARGGDTTALEKKYLRGAGATLVSLTELAAILADAAKLLADPLFGLHCALAMPRGGYGLLEFALRSAPTGRKAIEQLAHYGAIINPLVRWSLEVDGDEVSLHHRAPIAGGMGPQANIFTVTRILQISREMLGDQLVPRRAWFAHTTRAAPPELLAFLGTDRVTWGCSSSGVSFAAADLARAPRDADPELNRALELHGAAMMKACAADDLYERTRNALAELLPTGKASLGNTARRLHLSARTLQRHLDQEGVRFARLLAEVRRAQSERLLTHTDATLADVAAQVGYRDTAAFARAFRTWTGTTPGAFRDRVALTA
jgi:AraC-like DNA-binding protein